MVKSSYESKVSVGVLDVEKYGPKLLKTFLIPIVIIYLSLQPTAAAVFITEYFKFSPKVTLVVLNYSLPILIGLVISRSVFSTISTTLFFIIPVSLFIALAPVSLLIYFIKPVWFKHINNWVDLCTKKIDVVDTKAKEMFSSNIILALSIIAILFTCQNFDNFLGRSWNPKYNQMIEVTANLHYYCQITSGYNENLCTEWKNKRDQLTLTSK